ncbi:MAG: hypothetical protein ACYCSF_05655 [Acidimicrobiales bacterium]
MRVIGVIAAAARGERRLVDLDRAVVASWGQTTATTATFVTAAGVAATTATFVTAAGVATTTATFVTAAGVAATTTTFVTAAGVATTTATFVTAAGVPATGSRAARGIVPVRRPGRVGSAGTGMTWLRRERRSGCDRA